MISDDEDSDSSFEIFVSSKPTPPQSDNPNPPSMAYTVFYGRITGVFLTMCVFVFNLSRDGADKTEAPHSFKC